MCDKFDSLVHYQFLPLLLRILHTKKFSISDPTSRRTTLKVPGILCESCFLLIYNSSIWLVGSVITWLWSCDYMCWVCCSFMHGCWRRDSSMHSPSRWMRRRRWSTG